jgi:hypothetical protein
MKSLMLLTLVLLFCSSGSFGQMNNTAFDESMAAALRTLVIDSSANLSSYSFSMDMKQNIDLANLSTNETQKICTRSIGYGTANMTEKALKLSLASLTYAKGDQQNTSAIAIDEYLINDTLYLKVDGNWTAMKMPGIAESWSKQNTMNEQLEMFNQSRLTLVGSEDVDGEDCYKVLAVNNMGDMANQLSADMTSLLPIQSMNYSDIFRNMTLDICYWITKDTHLLKKTDVREVFTMTPQSLGLTGNESSNVQMQINSEIVMLFEGFNDRVSIRLPAEAEMAQSYPLGLIASGEVPSVTDGNETMLNETLKTDAVA